MDAESVSPRSARNGPGREHRRNGRRRTSRPRRVAVVDPHVGLQRVRASRDRRRGRPVRDRPGRPAPARLRLGALHDADRLLARSAHRRRRRHAARAPRLLPELGRDPSRRARADRPHPRPRARRAHPSVPDLGRLRVGRVGLEARTPAPPRPGRPRPAQGDRASRRLPRVLARGALADRHPGRARAVRAAPGRRAPRRQHGRAQLSRSAATRATRASTRPTRSSRRSSPRAPTPSPS